MPLDPSTRRYLDKLAARIAGLEARSRRSTRTAQGAFRSIEGGAQRAYDADGTLRQVVGAQPDGSYAAVNVNDPLPATPPRPIVVTVPGVIVVTVPPADTEGVDYPADFAGVSIHVGTEVEFEPNVGTEIARVASRSGGAVTFALPAGLEVVWVRLVTVTLSGRTSAPSVSTEVQVPPEVTDADVERIAADVATAVTRVLTGTVVRTADGGRRVQLTVDGLEAYNDAEQIVTTIMASNGRIVSSSALFASTDPASTAPGNVPALRIGAPAGRHLRLDGNDLLAMDDDDTQGELYLNTGGVTRTGDLNVLGMFRAPTRFNNAIYNLLALTLRVVNAAGETLGELQIAGGSNIRGKIRNTGQPSGGGVALTFLDTRVGVTTAEMNASDFSDANTQSFVSNQMTVFNGYFDNSQRGNGSAPAVFTAGGRLVRG